MSYENLVPYTGRDGSRRHACTGTLRGWRQRLNHRQGDKDGVITVKLGVVETRIIRLADGPDEVHRRVAARTELKRFEAGMEPKPSGLLSHFAS